MHLSVQAVAPDVLPTYVVCNCNPYSSIKICKRHTRPDISIKATPEKSYIRDSGLLPFQHLSEEVFMNVVVTPKYVDGIDLHSRTTSLCIMDKNGKILLKKSTPCISYYRTTGE
jgi:hypothetical protein